MAAKENARLAREVYESFNEHDFDSVLAQATEDVEVTQVAFGQTNRGREGFREFLTLWKTMAPDGEVEVTAQLPGEEGVTNENVWRGTHTGPLATPAGVLPATGRAFEVPFVEVWRIREGKLASIHNYVDSATLMQQLGVEPPTP